MIRIIIYPKGEQFLGSSFLHDVAQRLAIDFVPACQPLPAALVASPVLGGAPHVSRGRVAVGGFSLARVWILLRALRCQLGQLLHRGWWLDLFSFLLPSVLACLGPSRCLIGVLLRVAPLGAGSGGALAI